jgi:hypothetical protein
MPDLIETYARSTGLLIDRPSLREDFYPLPFERYITLAAGSNQGAKNYDYFTEVVSILTPLLGDIRIVLLGGKDDPAITGTHDLRAKTSYNQSYYILKRAMLHLANDSWLTHMAGEANVPTVALYGSTSAEIHGPHWRADKTALIESHRKGQIPSFSAHEPIKMINFIDPFQVVRKVLEFLALPNAPQSRTQYIGAQFNGQVLDFIPNRALHPGFNPDMPTAVRMDYEHNEQVLTQVLQSGRKVNIVTKAPINLDLLRALKGNILAYNHEVDESCDPTYLKEVSRILPRGTFYSRSLDPVVLASLRFKYLDIVYIQQVINKNRDDFINSAREYLNDSSFSLDSEDKLTKLKFKTNKFVLSREKIYLSHAHEKLDKPITDGQTTDAVIDDPAFWLDYLHYFIYVY